MSGQGNRMAISVAALVCGVAWSLVGCATMQPEASEQWYVSQKPVLEARAGERWDALIKADFDKVYSYSSPEYRAVVTSQQFKGGYGRVLAWRLARVIDVSYDAPTVANVSVEVTYQVDLPGSGKVIETQKAISEKWIYRDREWWYTSR